MNTLQTPFPFRTVPPYETWYAECQEKFDTANIRTRNKMLFRAVMFAGHSANNRVALCESDYSAWVVSDYSRKYRPAFCPNRWEDLFRSADEYISGLDDDWYARNKWELVNDLACNIKGLGAVKASFALALVGYNVACLDTHALQMAGYSIEDAQYIYGRTNPKRYRDAIDTYSAYHDAIFPDDARREQWAFFARDEPTFSATGHKCYFLSQGINCG